MCSILKYYLKIDGTTLDDTEDLDLVTPMYNLLGWNSNYCGTTGSIWFYSNNETTNFNTNIEDDNAFKSFKCQAKLLQNTEAYGANGTLKKHKDCCIIKVSQ